MGNLTGKIAIVTGANRGIGLEVTRQLARLGATVILGSRDLRKGESAAAPMIAEGLKVLPVRTENPVRLINTCTYGKWSMIIFVYIVTLIVRSFAYLHEPLPCSSCHFPHSICAST